MFRIAIRDQPIGAKEASKTFMLRSNNFLFHKKAFFPQPSKEFLFKSSSEAFTRTYFITHPKRTFERSPLEQFAYGNLDAKSNPFTRTIRPIIASLLRYCSDIVEKDKRIYCFLARTSERFEGDAREQKIHFSTLENSAANLITSRRNLRIISGSRLKSFKMPDSTSSAITGSTTTVVEEETKTKEKKLVLKSVKQPVEKFRKDYKLPDFAVDHVSLSFDLYDDKTSVKSILKMHRREGTSPVSLSLNGEDLTLHSLQVDGKKLERVGRQQTNSDEGEMIQNEKKDTSEECGIYNGYSLDVDGNLIIPSSFLPEEAKKEFEVETHVTVNPKDNLQLSGLYKSSGIFCTQCEAEGFRRITYFLDRPDIMCSFKVKVIGDKKDCPVLLSNGNLIDCGDVENDSERHFCVYEDPHKKPSYLFALVAGNIEKLSKNFKTMSGREVRVDIYSDPTDKEKLHWALESVLRAMKWDEERYGREYDLDVFVIVCCKDFNMGAMENKGLNIFNSALLLAHPKTTTDAEYQRILNVVGHEYFHNWTGNRVTCRDWFQLTLKEGLTVFRDQQFTASEFASSIKRIEDVVMLRSGQFSEDSGPMAHPIRPESYIAMDNFYTCTVYNKGAEVIRMYHTLLGDEGFRKGMDLYFERHDGQAVTCDDFRAAMANANNRDLTQFERWYDQAGTPLLEVLESRYDKESMSYTLKLKQSTPPTPNQPTKSPFHMPIRMGLIGKDSKKELLSPSDKVLELTEAEQTFMIPDISEDCVVSLLRDFSAPVKLVYPSQTDEDLAFLMAYDSDDFIKWQAGQQLAAKTILSRAKSLQEGKDVSMLDGIPKAYEDAFKTTLIAENICKSIQAYTLRFPDRESLSQEMNPMEPDSLHTSLSSIRKTLRLKFESDLERIYNSLTVKEGEKETQDLKDISRRRLRNVILFFLTAELDEKAAEFAYSHLKNAQTMTDKHAALSILSDCDSQLRSKALDEFYQEAVEDDLVLDKWFSIQAFSQLPNCVEEVTRLQQHKDFTYKNPNRLRSLMSCFARNPTQFHRKDGKGYTLVADCILLVDKFNPQMAASLEGNFLQWKKYGKDRQELMLKELRRIRSSPGLSPDVIEITNKALAEVEEAD